MKTTKKSFYMLFGMMAALAIGCLPDDFENNNGLSDPNVNAAFSVTPVEGRNNTYVVKAEEEDVLGVKWDFGDGAGAFMGKAIDTIFYPDAGDYDITLTAIGRGGKTATSTNTVTVATSDPNAGNLVIGGKMDDGDDANWEFVTYTAGVTLNLIDGKMVATGGAWGHAGIYQAIEVEGGKKYKVDMVVSSTTGATDCWFEVYVGQSEPVPGTDYADGGKRLALNTWAGCGNTAFSGKLSALSCDGGDGTVEFENSGTAYLMIRTGGASLGSGITIDNVELRGTN